MIQELDVLRSYISQKNYCTYLPIFVTDETYPKVFLTENEAKEYISNKNEVNYTCCSLRENSLLHSLLHKLAERYLDDLGVDELIQARNIGLLTF